MAPPDYDEDVELTEAEVDADVQTWLVTVLVLAALAVLELAVLRNSGLI